MVPFGERLLEPVLFQPEFGQDGLAIGDQFGILPAILLDDDLRQFHPVVRLYSERFAIADGAADQPAQHISLALVGGFDAHLVADDEGRRPDVIGQNADRLELLRIRPDRLLGQAR